MDVIMEFFETVKKRISVREFSNKTIAKTELEKILDCARLAATARNEQPWRFVVINDKNKINELAKLVSPNGAFLSAATAAIVVLTVETKYYLEDCSAATQNILLAATALGIGSCWIAGDKKDYVGAVGAFVSAKPTEKLFSVVALGYPLKPVTAKPKKSLAELIRWQN